MATTYKLEDLEDSDDEEIPPTENLSSAAAFICSLLDQNGFQYALQGGYALIANGSTRVTRDIDLCIQAPPKWPNLRGILSREARLVIPSIRLVSGVLRIFVHTGVPFDACAQKRKVQVDIIESGFSGTPADLTDKTIDIQLAAGIVVHHLNWFFLFRSKLSAVSHRKKARDVEDCLWMLREHGDVILQQKHLLDQFQVESLIQSVPRTQGDWLRARLN